MLIEVTRFQFQLFWCSHGDFYDPWYLYLVGSVPTGDIRAACLGVVQKHTTPALGQPAAWYATSYEDSEATLSCPMAYDRQVVCASAAVALWKQALSPNTAMAEWALRLDMDDEDEWVMPLLSDIKASYAILEPVCLLK